MREPLLVLVWLFSMQSLFNTRVVYLMIFDIGLLRAKHVMNFIGYMRNIISTILATDPLQVDDNFDWRVTGHDQNKVFPLRCVYWLVIGVWWDEDEITSGDLFLFFKV